MVEIEFSYIHSSPQDEQTLSDMMEEFTAQHRVKVRLRRMDWPTAWPEILMIVSHSNGPDVSYVGGTWVSSLAKMNALRPFKANEIIPRGEPVPFIKPIWESASLFEAPNIWSIPWTSWIYLICYRKDLLEKVGVDIPNAFNTIHAFDHTIRQLKNSAIEIPWLNPYIPHPYADLLHMAVSWVWSAGGDYINDLGTKVAFDSPQAIDGLSMWLDTYRIIPEAYRKLDLEDCYALFRKGDIAAMVADIPHANMLMDDARNDQRAQEQLGIAALTNTPWIGSDNLVIWNYVCGYPERELAALELVQFLTSKESNLRWNQKCRQMPARVDALQEIYPVGNPLREAIDLVSHDGRSYYNIPLWRRIQQDVSQALAVSIMEAQENPQVGSASILRKQLEPLAQRLNRVLAS